MHLRRRSLAVFKNSSVLQHRKLILRMSLNRMGTPYVRNENKGNTRKLKFVSPCAECKCFKENRPAYCSVT